MISCDKDGPYIGFSHCPVCSAKYATEMGRTIRQLETALAAMTADRDAQAEAVRVLSDEVRWWNYHHSDHDEICKAKVDRKNNPIAAAAVEHKETEQ